MSSNPIDHYLSSCLVPKLLELSVNDKIISIICTDIRNRLHAIIKQWPNLNVRRTLLVTGYEEAMFYEPPGELDTRALVVVAIRNSKIEDLASTKQAAQNLGASGPMISDDNIRELTQEAIKFFKQFDMQSISDQLSADFLDPYKDFNKLYPVAWKALFYLGQWNKFAVEYKPIIKPPLKILRAPVATPTTKNLSTDVQSGMDPTMSPKLLAMLQMISDGKLDVLYVDSFKMITRNPEKLFKIIEIVLRAKSKVVTTNFYISNGFVARRKELLRPAHSTRDVLRNLKDASGLVKSHRNVLNQLRKDLED